MGLTAFELKMVAVLSSGRLSYWCLRCYRGGVLRWPEIQCMQIRHQITVQDLSLSFLKHVRHFDDSVTLGPAPGCAVKWTNCSAAIVSRLRAWRACRIDNKHSSAPPLDPC
jgi:hypothetical protein